MIFDTFFKDTSIPSLDLKLRAERLNPKSVHDVFLEMGVDKNKAKGAALIGLGLLWHDHWEQSHQAVQAFEGDPNCDLVHSILHRREGDLSNARYWCRHVADHPGFSWIAAAMQEHLGNLPAISLFLKDGVWQPEAFLKSVIKDPRNPELQFIQALELKALAQSWWPRSP